MQDKEFDQLFNSKIGNFEVEPSPMVWENIASDLQQKKRRLWPYISIAASVVILVSAGLLFMRKDAEDITKPMKPGRVIVKINKPAAPVNFADNNVAAITRKANPTVNDKPVKSNNVFTVPQLTVNREPSQKAITEDKAPVLIAEIPPQSESTLTAVTPVQNKPIMQIPDKSTAFVVNSIVNPTAEDVAATAEPANTTVKKRGIHSLGGLIGAIVAKVDKREDKLIEFTEGDEDRSTITGLNLGFVKIKKK